MKRILLKLTTDQKLLINKWFDVTRVVYNHALHAVESQRVPCKLQDLRNAFVKKGCPFLQKHTWAEENVPFDVRDEAIRDLCKAYKSNFAKLRAGYNTHFKIKFQRKRGGYGSMSFLKKHWGAKDRTYFKRTLKQWTGSEAGTRIGSREPIPNMDHDGRIIKENGRYYLIVTNTREYTPSSENQRIGEHGHSVVAIDPGVRTFLTCYDPSGAVVEVGKDSITKLEQLRQRMQALRQKAKSAPRPIKRRIHQSANRLSAQMRNLVDSVHYSVSKWLAQTYVVILLPKMDVPQLVKKEGRKLNRKGASNLLAWRHSKFYERLQYQCHRYGSRIVDCTEEYTSKTCGQCGQINASLGSSKTFMCPCGFHIDRDFNGARNILLKALNN